MALQFGQGAFYKRFQNPYSYSVKQPDKDTVERIMQAMANRNRTELELNAKRSFLDRTFDALLTPNYMVAGAFDGAIRDDKTVMQGLIGGLKAGNPFGKGFEQGETTFSDVIRSTGVNPTSFLGKATVGTAGFALDVILDPTTYLSGGLSAIAKGTGRVGTATKALEELAKVVPPSMLDETGKIKEMTDEIAQHIVTNARKGEKLSAEQLASEAGSLKQKYHELIGIRDTSKGITFGLGNVPLGEKLANKLGVKPTYKISSGNTLRNMSDSLGIARTYQATRNAFYGSKMGSLLSRNAGLKQLAEVEPAKLYEYIGAVNAVQGRNLDKFARDKEIKNLGRELLNLDPATQSKIIQALETPTVWKKVSDVLKFSQTEASKTLKNAYGKEIKNIDSSVEQLRKFGDDVTELSEEQMVAMKKRSKDLEAVKNKTTSQQKELDEIAEVLGKISVPKNLTEIITKLEKELADSRVMYKQMFETEGETVGKGKFSEMQPEDIVKHFETSKSGIDDVQKEIDEIVDTIKQITAKQNVDEMEQLLYHGEVPKDFHDKATKIKQETNGEKLNAIASKNQLTHVLRQDVSHLLFGRADVLPRDLSEGSLNQIVELISKNRDALDLEEAIKKSNLIKKEDKDAFIKMSDEEGLYGTLRQYLEANTDILHDKNRMIYKHLASKYGYRDIQETYARVKELQQILMKKGGNRTARLEAEDELNGIMKMLSKRDEDLTKLRGMTVGQARKAIQEETDAIIREDLYKTLYDEADLPLARNERLIEQSDTTDQFNPYKEDIDTTKSMSVEEAEINRMRENRQSTKLSDEQRKEDADLIFEDMVYKLQKSKFENSLTPQARQTYQEVAKLKNEMKALQSNVEYFKWVVGESGKHKDKYNNAVRAYNEGREKYNQKLSDLRNKTNYYQAKKQSREFSDGQLKSFEMQEEVTYSLMKELFPNHYYRDLTTRQKNMLRASSYYAVKEHREAGKGADTLAEKIDELIKGFKKKTEDESIIRNLVDVVNKLEDTLDVGMGVRVYDGDELVEGRIIQRVEDKKPKSYTESSTTRESGVVWFENVQVPKLDKKGKPVIGKDGKPKMIFKDVRRNTPTTTEHTLTQVPYKEGYGTFSYKVELSNGKTVDVKAKDVKGTYVEREHYDLVTLPKFAKEELERAELQVTQLRRKLSATKGVQTRNTRKYEEAIKAYEELVARKQTLESSLKNFSDIEKGIYDELSLMASNYDELIEVSKGYSSKVDDLLKRREEILNALDNDDAFELLVRREYGDKEVNKLIDKANWEESSRIALDDMNYSDYEKRMIKTLREEFQQAGLKEVEIGKLSGKAFDSMMERYFPRSLSEEGRIYFQENPTMAEKFGVVSSEYGFGGEWNPYAKSRTTGDKSLKEINDYFQSKVGVRIFEENVGLAYVNRMLKHSDLVYDEKVMKDLMNKFGHAYSGETMDGYKVVMNYGQVRKAISDDASELMRETLREARKAGKPIDSSDEAMKKLYEDALTESIARYGLDDKVLKGQVTPMMELTKEQARHIQSIKPHLVRQVNGITVDKLNQTKRLTMERDEHRLLQLYDKFMTLFKMNQTTVSPAFHVRNKLGNDFQGWLGTGVDVFNPKMQIDSMKAVMAYGDFQKLRALKPVTSEHGVFYWDEIWDLALSHGVIDEGFIAKEFGANGTVKGTGILPGKIDPFNTQEFVPYKIGGKIGTGVDNQGRLLQFASLLKQGKSASEATESVRKYLFDYGDLTDFEKRVMKRIFPYYTWMRKNTPLMMRELINQPEKFRLIAKGENAINGMVNPEDEVNRAFVSDFARDWIQLPFNITNSKGEKEPVLFNPNLPYGDMKEYPTGDMGDTFRTYFSQSTPLLKLPIELATNWNSFFDSPIQQEWDNPITPRVLHVMSQLFAFNAVNQVVNADTGDDALMSIGNTLTGIKTMSYDVESNKQRVYEEAYNNKYKETFLDMLGDKAVTMMKTGHNALDKALRDTAIDLYGINPDAMSMTGALAPISMDTFKSLSDEEKKKYQVSEDELFYYSKRAKELEEQAYNEAGYVKKRVWMLLDGTAPERTVAKVARVVDGDTFEVIVGDENYKTRVLLIDTPETVKPGVDPQPFGKEASDEAKKMVFGRDVTILIDGYDRFGRALSFIEVDGEDYGKSMVDKGLAKVRFTDDTNYTNELREYYNREVEASKKKKGFWSLDGYSTPGVDTGFKQR